MKIESRKKLIVLLSVLLAVVILFVMGINDSMKTVNYTVETHSEGDSVRIALITDLHSCKYGDGQIDLINAVDAQKPDIVLMGGDIFDDALPLENAEIFVRSIAQKYPCFYVSGNHEYWSGNVDEIKQTVRDAGITVLDGECRTVRVGNRAVNICGVDDPTEIGEEAMFGQLEQALSNADKEAFTVLLSHRPELIDKYLNYEVDLVLAGHAHGGQWRIPGILNGLYAPDQGFFPKYAGGRYDFDGATMIVSRGLAHETTRIPRFFNHRELVVIDLV
ncbi:MAG: metallophosphoesterase [Acutalibacteraceae bacterium]